MATLTATPEPDFSPPRVRLDLATGGSGETFSSISIRRNGALLREQPYTGGPTAVVYDYETPRGVPVEYAAEVVSGGWTATYSTTWANLTGWAVVGSTSLSGGTVSLTTAPGTASLTRSVATSAPRRLVISNLSQWSELSFTVGDVMMTFSTWQGIFIGYGDSWAGRQLPVTSGPLTVDWNGVQATVTWPTGSIVLPHGGINRQQRIFFEIQPWDDGAPRTGTAGGFALEQMVGDPSPQTLTASSQLDVDAVWMVNPVAPTVSMALDSGDCSHDDSHLAIMWPSADERVSADARHLHAPVGRARQVAISTGPRLDYEWSLVVKAPTIELQHRLRDMLYNQSPLLLLVPPHIRWDIDGGWYSVGQVAIRRLVQAVVLEETLFTLPLTPIDPPAVSQGAVRTWGDVLGEAATWADLIDMYPTWTDVLVGP